MADKFLFFTKMNFAAKGNSGIKKKVFAQAAAFRSLGFEVDILFFENNEVIIESANSRVVFEAKNKIQFLKYLYGGFLNNETYRNYKYVYIRHFLTNPLFILMLSKLHKFNAQIKIFMEIPTYPYRYEFADMPLAKRLGLWIDDRCVPYFKKYISKIVTFSAEKEIFGIPTILTDNGIDPSQFPKLPKAAFDGKNLQLLALANVQKWHGIDRLVEGIKLYNEHTTKYKVILNIGGEGAEIPHLKELVEKYLLADFVVFHGFVSGDALTALFQKSHVGLGSFGMHRIGVADGQTSTLKAREYASRGLPIVIGHKDRGFPDDFKFLLELPANESPVEMQKIVDFYMGIQQFGDYTVAINAFAEENLTWKKNLKAVADAYRA